MNFINFVRVAGITAVALGMLALAVPWIEMMLTFVGFGIIAFVVVLGLTLDENNNNKGTENEGTG